MENLSEKQRRDVIVNYYVKNMDAGKAYTVKHFEAMGIAKSSIYSILAVFEKRGETKRKKGSGRPAVKLPSAARKRLVKAASDKKAISTRKLGKRYGVHHSYVSKVLKESNVKYYKREKAPDTTPEQEAAQRTRSRRLSRDFLPARSTRKVVMDDESYFPFKHDEMPGNVGFYTQDKENTPPAVRFRPKTKFPKKLLVWIAISEEGHSQPFFVPNRGNINGEVYRRECIEARLVPFIHELHSDNDYIFWPDLASAHYAAATQELLRQQNINFVPKDANPPNSPQLRPIEDFWSWLKQLVYEGGWEATSEAQLRRRINNCLAKLDWGLVQTVMQKVKSRVRKAADHGALAVQH